MSMYADYIRERLGDGIIEREEGFATYRYIDNEGIPSVYIIDIYIRPDFRKHVTGKTPVSAEMADEICENAKNRGCKRLIGSVVPSAKKSTDSLRAFLTYGMSLQSCEHDFIVLKKEI